jgi:hypothetical protein
MAEMFPDAGEDALRRVVEPDWSELGGTVLAVEDVARAALYLASDDAPGWRFHCAQECQHAIFGGVEPLRRDQLSSELQAV